MKGNKKSKMQLGMRFTGGGMRKLTSYLLLLGIIFLMPAFAWSWSDSSKKILEDLLIAEGIEKAQAQKIMRDPRLSIRPSFVIKNLFCSSPRGTSQRPDIMQISPRQIALGKAFMKKHAASLSAVEKSFGTSSRIITAILIIESRLATCPMPFNVANAYVNMALLQNPDYLKEVQALYAKAYPQINDQNTVVRAKSKARWAVYELANLIHLANGLGMDPLTISGSFSGGAGTGAVPAFFFPALRRRRGRGRHCQSVQSDGREIQHRSLSPDLRLGGGRLPRPEDEGCLVL